MGLFGKRSSDRKKSKEDKLKKNFYAFVESLFPGEYYQREFTGPNPLDAEPVTQFQAPQFLYVHQISGTRVGVVCRFMMDIPPEPELINLINPVTLEAMKPYHAQAAHLYLIVGIGHNPRDLDHLCLVPLYYIQPMTNRAGLLKFERNKKEIFGCFMGKLT